MNTKTNSSTTPNTPLPIPERWAVASLSLSTLMPSLDTSIANAGLPTLARAFDASFQHVQWIVLAYLLTITTLIVSAGRLGDLIGRRRLLLHGIGLFTLASLLCGIAPTLWLLVAARAVQGLGAAIMLALTVALVGETVPKARVGSAMGLLGTLSAIGTTLGPSLGGVLITGFGWRTIFLVNVPVGVLALVLARRYLPADRAPSTAVRNPVDRAGTVVLALTLFSYAMAMTTAIGGGGPSRLTWLLGAAVGVILFVRVQTKSKSPLIQIALLRQPTLGASLLMSALIATIMMATLVVGPFYLSRSLHIDTAFVGLVLSIGPLVVVLTGVPAGRLVDRFGTPRILIAGLVSIMAGCLTLAALPSSLGLVGYLVPLIAITLGYALFQAGNNTSLMTTISSEQRGTMSGLLNLSRNLGLITGASVMGAIFIAAGMRFTFGVASMLAATALVIAYATHRRSQPGAVARQMTPATMHSAPVMRLHPAGSLSKRLPK